MGIEANESWQDYVSGYRASDGEVMIRGWEAFKKEVGEKEALRVFWDWQSTLPRDQRSDVDPDGN